MNTTHFSILDAEGNRVAGTITLNAGFGSGLMVDGTGLLLNNQMDDFSVKPGVPNIYGLIGASANAIEPGKRMLSSITPTFVESPRGFMIVGQPGWQPDHRHGAAGDARLDRWPQCAADRRRAAHPSPVPAGHARP